MDDIGVDEQLAARDYFQTVHYPAVGRDLRVVGPFAKMTRTPLAAAAPSPALGQHTEAILRGERGLSTEDLGRLYSQGVI
jgi:crotonobetainyl-CoA:carnitine CoA-transferase CaiB-like acyl-CoA transferase